MDQTGRFLEVTLHSSATADLRETNLVSGYVLEPVMLDESEAKVFQAPRF